MSFTQTDNTLLVSIMAFLDEKRFPLGNEFYLTHIQYLGKVSIHIRKFKAMTSLYTYYPKQTVIEPTKYGITMSLGQLQILVKSLPTIMPEMFDMFATNRLDFLPQQFAKDVGKISLGGDLYLAPCSWDGNLNVHIRTFTPTKRLVNRKTYDTEHLQPTKNGVVLSIQQTLSLYNHVYTNEVFSMTPPERPTSVPASTSDQVLKDITNNNFSEQVGSNTLDSLMLSDRFRGLSCYVSDEEMEILKLSNV